ncbi:glycosyltransferase [Leucobacter sp.]
MSRRTPKRVVYDLLQIAGLRRAGESFPPVARPAGAGAARSLFIGPANSAGQGAAWARAAERTGFGIAAVSMAFRRGGGFAFDVDQSVPSAYGAHSRAWQRRQLAAVSGFDAALLESGLPPFAGLLGGEPLAQIRALESAGVRTALVFHGSDIRDPDRHLAAEPHSHFDDADFARTFREVTARNRSLVSAAGIPVFVSTPALLDELPGARWLPVVVDPGRWASPAPSFGGDGPPRVVHIPSSSTVKGSELIEPVLHRLAAAGRIDYRPVAGIPHAEMPAAYRAADIVVDQFRVGDYGVAACEALAAGRLVISHVSDRVRERTLELTGDALPVVEATPETLDAVLADVARHPGHYAEIAAGGPGFVRRHHDGRRSGLVLAEWMGCAAPAEEAER